MKWSDVSNKGEVTRNIRARKISRGCRASALWEKIDNCTPRQYKSGLNVKTHRIPESTVFYDPRLILRARILLYFLCKK